MLLDSFAARVTYLNSVQTQRTLEFMPQIHKPEEQATDDWFASKQNIIECVLRVMIQVIPRERVDRALKREAITFFSVSVSTLFWNGCTLSIIE
jgi:hypothetical protein